MSDDQEKSLLRAYKAMDRRVLDDMLIDLYFITPAATEGEQALNNYAKVLLGKVFAPEIKPYTFWGLIERLLRRTK